MTKFGKCDVCRARKVKCDEQKPTCTSCHRAKRQCTYTVASSDIIVRSTFRSTPTGMSLSPRRSLSTSAHSSQSHSRSPDEPGTSIEGAQSLARATQRLAAQWAHMLDERVSEEPSMSEIVGIWSRVPVRLGLVSLLDSVTTQLSDNPDDAPSPERHKSRNTPEGSPQAMRVIRDAVILHLDGPRVAAPVLQSILTVNELFDSYESHRTQFHVSALCYHLKLRWSSGHWSLFEEALMRKIWLEEMEHALYAGTDSLFDDLLRLQVRRAAALPVVDELESAAELIREKCIKIPRLARLVRQLAMRPDDGNIKAEVIALALEVYDGKSQGYLEVLVQKHSLTRPSTHQPFTNPFESRREFTSTQAALLNASYFTYRGLICGMLLWLHELNVSNLPSNRNLLAIEASAAAKCICMCAENALQPTSTRIFHALRILHPLIVAWGVFDRLQELQRISGYASDANTDPLRAMKAYCKQAAGRVLQLWYPGTPLVRFEEKAHASVGGPALLPLST